MRAALGFLTRLPVGRVQVEDPFRKMGEEAPYFPLVGLAVGAVTLLVYLAAGMLYGRGVQAVAAVITGLLVTGALHLDGLMDTVDGVGSYRTRERMLEVMKDSRVGAMGVVAAVSSLLLRTVLLLDISTSAVWMALLVAPALGRMSMALAAGFWPPARTGSSMGASFAAYVGPRQVGGAALIGLLVAVGVGRVGGALAWILTWGVTGLMGWRLSAKLGGLTGDTYGCINEVVEIMVLAAFAALP